MSPASRRWDAAARWRPTPVVVALEPWLFADVNRPPFFVGSTEYLRA